MKTLEVTEEQYAFIQQLRTAISDEVVGRYGFVREQDALQFLIDNLDGDVDVVADFDVSTADAETEPNELETVAYDEETDPDTAGETADGSDVDADVDAIETTDDGSEDGSPDGNGDADDDEMLDEMMSLLETHDDKWEESSSSDYRYTVELPDGTTEDVQTKDDVRALLFKNYR